MALLSDDQLMEKVANGDAKAFKALFERHGPKVLGYAARLLGNPSQAEDLSQEVWLKVVKLAPNYQKQGYFLAWIKTMTRNAAFNILRNQKKWAPLDELNENVEASDTETIEDELLKQANLDELKMHIDGLPDQQRVAIVMWLTEQMSYEELAQKMETSVSSVKSLLFRARKNLEKKFKEAI